MPIIKFVRTEIMDVHYPYYIRKVDKDGQNCEVTKYTEDERVIVQVEKHGVQIVRMNRQCNDGVIVGNNMYFCTEDCFKAQLERAKRKITALVI